MSRQKGHQQLWLFQASPPGTTSCPVPGHARILSPRPCLAMPGLHLRPAPLEGPDPELPPRADVLAQPQPVPSPLQVPDAGLCGMRNSLSCQLSGAPSPCGPPMWCFLLLTTSSREAAVSFYNSRITTSVFLPSSDEAVELHASFAEL